MSNDFDMLMCIIGSGASVGREMDLSVIVPVYRISGGQLRNCIDSIKKAVNSPHSFVKHGGYEIIVVCDEPQQATSLVRNEMSQIAQDNVRLVFQPHAGVSAARNHGLRLACGEWIGFVDADDLVTENAWDVSSQLLAKKPDVIFFNHFRKYNSLEKIQYWKQDTFTAKSTNSFLRDVLSPGTDQGTVWGKLFRRTFLSENQLTFSEELAIGEDQYFMVQTVLRAKSLASSKSFGYIYSCNSASTVRAFRLDMRERIDKATHYIFEELRNEGLLDSRDGIVRKAFENYLLDRILALTINYYFHPDAPIEIRNKKAYFAFLLSAPYGDALQALSLKSLFPGDGRNLPVAKGFTLLCARYRLYQLVKIAAEIRHRELASIVS